MIARIPEPEIMDDPAQVDAYVASVRERELIAPTHAVLMQRAARVMPKNGRVLDLGCGPGDPVVQLLQRRPDLRATAVDLSEHMLDSANALASERGVADRAAFQQADITTLDRFESSAFDGVITTLALHHLPDAEMLRACIHQIERVLKPEGSLFVADFARMPSERWMNRFADRDSDIQSDLYRRDFFNSMRAAWSAGEMRDACASLSLPCEHHTTPILPFLQVITTRPIPGIRPRPHQGLLSARARRTARQLDLWLRLASARKQPVGRASLVKHAA